MLCTAPLTSSALFCIGHVIAGLGVGFISNTIILYMPEIAPKKVRSALIANKLKKAAKALAQVRSQPIDSSYVSDELAEIVANNEYETALVPATGYIGGWLACFKGSIRDPSSKLRRTIFGTGLQAMQQLTGINFIFYFGTSFFQTLGTIKNPFLTEVITNIVNFVATQLPSGS